MTITVTLLKVLGGVIITPLKLNKCCSTTSILTVYFNFVAAEETVKPIYSCGHMVFRTHACSCIPQYFSARSKLEACNNVAIGQNSCPGKKTKGNDELCRNAARLTDSG